MPWRMRVCLSGNYKNVFIIAIEAFRIFQAVPTHFCSKLMPGAKVRSYRLTIAELCVQKGKKYRKDRGRQADRYLNLLRLRFYPQHPAEPVSSHSIPCRAKKLLTSSVQHTPFGLDFSQNDFPPLMMVLIVSAISGSLFSTIA